MNKTVQDYQRIINKCQNKILELQNSCPHPSYTVQMYSWRPGAMQPTRMCDYCQACLIGITEEEIKKMWDEWNKPMNDYSQQMNKSNIVYTVEE